MTSKGTSIGTLMLAAAFVIVPSLIPGPASAKKATSMSTPSKENERIGLTLIALTEPPPEGGEAIYDGGVPAPAGEAGKPKDPSQYGGPLGGLGIKCEDQKDLEALALGTYGNLLKALSNSPGVVRCPNQSGGPDDGGAPSEKAGTPEEKGEKK
jgi:hypothetical protein